MKYKQNLRIEGVTVFSYNTRVAEIDFQNNILLILGWWSVTTSKHVNYISKYYHLNRFYVRDMIKNSDYGYHIVDNNLIHYFDKNKQFEVTKIYIGD